MTTSCVETHRPALRVDDLTVATAYGDPIVSGLSMTLHPGEMLALIGESGSGKTTTALAMLGWANPGTVITCGQIHISDTPILGRPEQQTRRLRSRLVSYVPQDPGRALNPARRVGAQLAEILRAHGKRGDRERTIARVLEQVRLPTGRGFQRRFPHQLSGGQRQRLTIAQALLLEPALIVLDEPTTGLDTLTQHELLTHLDQLRIQVGAAMVYVTHDVAAIAERADQVAVLYAGTMVEYGPAAAVLDQSRHPYTRGLLDAVPDPRDPRPLVGIPGTVAPVGARPAGCGFATRCAHTRDRCRTTPPTVALVEHRVSCHYPIDIAAPRVVSVQAPPRNEPASTLLRIRGLRASHRGRGETVIAADQVDLDIPAGSCFALVGASGSGKTTIGRCVAGLHRPDSGTLTLDGSTLAPTARGRTPEQRRRIQTVFQNPADSLNPRRTIGAEIARPLRFHDTVEAGRVDHRVAELLDCVRLPAALADRYPGELSGGEQQRVAIARALAAEPALLVCDEITSALDVSVQAAVIDLLIALRGELGLSLLFISHDLGLVAAVSDQVAVLDGGRIRDSGPTLGVFERGAVRRLLAAAPGPASGR